MLAAAVAAMVLVACGGDDGAASPTTADGAPVLGSGDGPAIAGSVGDENLLVPRDYLQGEWCDTDGQTWTIDGDTARLEDGSGGAGELPVDLAFIKRPGDTLVSQTDDSFVVESDGAETTFQRGRC